jgi:hypothetical protein
MIFFGRTPNSRTVFSAVNHLSDGPAMALEKSTKLYFSPPLARTPSTVYEAGASIGAGVDAPVLAMPRPM